MIWRGVALVLGGCLIWYGAQEWMVGGSPAPANIALGELEAGAPVPDSHVRIGLHHCLYGASIIDWASDIDRREQSAESRVRFTYSPLISEQHPYLGALRRFEQLRGGLEQLPPGVAWPELDEFRVLLRSEAYPRFGDVPRGRVRYASVSGLVINRIEPLDDATRRELRTRFPGLDLHGLVVVEHGREPVAKWVCALIIVVGVALALSAYPRARAVRPLP